jgi:prepilin-type N-terminal cleavage/methylation domain-containing protein
MTKRPSHGSSGFSLIEMLVAISLLSTLTTALTQTLIAAHRSRAMLQRSAAAVRVAEAGLEQLRSGGSVAPAMDQDLVRDVTFEMIEPDLGLYRARVAVRSKSLPSLAVDLVTLVQP